VEKTKIKGTNLGWQSGSVVECLPSKHEGLSPEGKKKVKKAIFISFIEIQMKTMKKFLTDS
jgi:hypothetical protein